MLDSASISKIGAIDLVTGCVCVYKGAVRETEDTVLRPKFS